MFTWGERSAGTGSGVVRATSMATREKEARSNMADQSDDGKKTFDRDTVNTR